ncbi:hypothetical protein INR49_023948, partial [Caranx melampygus]
MWSWEKAEVKPRGSEEEGEEGRTGADRKTNPPGTKYGFTFLDSAIICVHACVCICVAMKHQSISRWLSQLGLPQYCTALEQEYDGVEDLLHLSEYDLLELGVHNHLHRLHLLTSLRLLQERERRR